MDLTEDGVEVPPGPADASTPSGAHTHTLVSSDARTGPVVAPPDAMATSGSRPDRSRTPAQLRPLACEWGVLHRADGSARMAIGDTCVLVGVYGPKTMKAGRVGDPDETAVAVSISGASTCYVKFFEAWFRGRAPCAWSVRGWESC